VKKPADWIYGLVILFAIIIAGGVNARAQSFLVTPAMLELDVYPGEEKSFTLRVLNASQEKQTFRVYLTDFVLKKEGDLEFPPPASSRYSCASWIKVKPSEFSLGPRNGIEIAGQISVPRGESGGRYATIIVEPVKKSSLSPGKIMPRVHYRIAVFVLLTVQGGRLEEKMEISQIKLIPSQKGEEIIVSLKNAGNVHLIGKGKVVVKDASGRRWGETALEAGRGIVLAYGERDFRGILGKSLPAGEYTLEVTVEYRRTDRWRQLVVKKQIPYVVQEAAAGLEGELPLRVSVEPSSLNVVLPPGARRFFIIRFTSKEEVPLEVKTVIAKPEPSLQSCVEWLKIEPRQFYLQPDREEKLKLSINVPLNVKGKYSAQLVFSTGFLSSEKERGESKVKVNISVSTP